MCANYEDPMIMIRTESDECLALPKSVSRMVPREVPETIAKDFKEATSVLTVSE